MPGLGFTVQDLGFRVKAFRGSLRARLEMNGFRIAIQVWGLEPGDGFCGSFVLGDGVLTWMS